MRTEPLPIMKSIFSTWWRPAVFLSPPSRLFTDSKKPLRQAKLSALRLAGGRFNSFSLHKQDKKSVFPDPDPPDPHVHGPPGSGSISQRYGSGSGSFYHHAKIVRKTLIPTILCLFLTFYLWKMMYMLCTVPSKCDQKNFFLISFLLASWRSMTKIAGSGSISQRNGSADPDPHQNVMDPQHCKKYLAWVCFFLSVRECSRKRQDVPSMWLPEKLLLRFWLHVQDTLGEPAEH